MALSANSIKNAKPKDKQYKLTDERGLYLLVSPNGGKWWRFDYRFDGKRKTLSLGTYPDVGLKKARAKRDELREQIADGINPGQSRKASKAAGHSADSFEAVAREWQIKQATVWTERHAGRVLKRLETDIFPWIGSVPMNDITAPQLLSVIRRIEGRGTIETAHRALQCCSQVYRYGIATGRAERDTAADLRGSLSPLNVRHHSSITEPKAVGALMRSINAYTGHYVTASALKLAPLLFVRPGELRQAEWTEFDLDKAEWRIPAEKMKMKAIHIVPLSKQAVEIIRDLYPLTGNGRYLFPSLRSYTRPMSNNTINAALRRMGYSKEEMTGHGFRSMASTLLNEQGWHRDAIERQLAHGERDKVRAAYNYAEHLPERRKMMQEWADYLEGLKAGITGTD